jgi:hypothetical protein
MARHFYFAPDFGDFAVDDQNVARSIPREDLLHIFSPQTSHRSQTSPSASDNSNLLGSKFGDKLFVLMTVSYAEDRGTVCAKRGQLIGEPDRFGRSPACRRAGRNITTGPFRSAKVTVLSPSRGRKHGAVSPSRSSDILGSKLYPLAFQPSGEYKTPMNENSNSTQQKRDVL